MSTEPDLPGQEQPTALAPKPKSKAPFWIGLVAAIVIISAIGAATKDDEDDTKPSPNLELIRVTWNAMSAAEQRDLCLSVELLGVDAVAAEMAAGLGKGRSFAEDAEFFLTDLACD